MHVVIGTGPAGLAAAWELHRNGHEVLAIEPSDRVGGHAASVTVGDASVDLRPRRLDGGLPEWLRRRLERLVELDVGVRDDRVRVEGRWLPYPPSSAALVRSLPLRDLARVGLERLAGAHRTIASDRYDAVVRAEVGPTLARLVHEPAVRKRYGTDPGVLAGELARRSAQSVIGVHPGSSTALYPVGGIGALIGALAAPVTVETGRRVTRLIERDDRIIVGLADGRVVTASRVLAAVPPTVVAGWLALGSGGAGPADELPARSVVVVHLVLDTPRYSDVGVYELPAPQLLPARVVEAANFSARPPSSERTVLCIEVPCWEGDDVWRAADGALVERVLDDLVRCGLPRCSLAGVRIERLRGVDPVPTPAALDAAAGAVTVVAGTERVTLLGGPIVGGDIGRALESGVVAAGCVGDDGAFDHDRWRAARIEIGRRPTAAGAERGPRRVSARVG